VIRRYLKLDQEAFRKCLPAVIPLLRILQQKHKLAVDLATFVEATFRCRLCADEFWHVKLFTLVLLMRPEMNQKTQTGVWFIVPKSADCDLATLHRMAAHFQVARFRPAQDLPRADFNIAV
jgi:hypothetical protein